MEKHGAWDMGALSNEIRSFNGVRSVGRVCQAGQGTISVDALGAHAAIGDLVTVGSGAARLRGEVVAISQELTLVLPDGPGEGIRIGDPVVLDGPPAIAPSESWIGRIIDPHCEPLDGRPLRKGMAGCPLKAIPPRATERRPMGRRLSTGLAVFDTLLPIVRGQRIGVFSGSGVGKSTMLADLARGVEGADVNVIALVGERGREVRDFVENTLGKAGMAKSIVVAATSDQPPLTRRRALWVAMCVAEFFRDLGKHVLFLADSVTRFAEAHREIALASGETPSLRGFPPSVAHLIMGLAERSGPGSHESGGDITAVFTVLVAGSDMDEPISDILRGVLDGHIVLDRQIAERGRFPAINLLKSVSRSLPEAADREQNDLIQMARQRLGAYERAELMIQSGLYSSGSDPEIDAAIRVWASLDRFMAERSPDGIEQAFSRLADCLAASKRP